MVFPCERYFKETGFMLRERRLFSKILEKRYLENGFDLVNVIMPCDTGERGSLSLGVIGKNIPALETGETIHTYPLSNVRRIWDDIGERTAHLFGSIAKHVGVKNDDVVAVGGFHMDDCVAKTAEKIADINPRVFVDPHVTNCSNIYASPCDCFTAHRLQKGTTKIEESIALFNAEDYETVCAYNSFQFKKTQPEIEKIVQAAGIFK